MTLTLDLSQQTFRMTLVLIKYNNCAKLFSNLSINVEVMHWTRSILLFDLQLWPWPWTCITIIISHDTSTHQEEQLCQVIFKSIHKCRSYAPDKVNFVVWPSNVNLTLDISQQPFLMILVLIKYNNCAKLFSNPSINVEVMLRTRSILSFDLQLWPWPWRYHNKCFTWQ